MSILALWGLLITYHELPQQGLNVTFSAVLLTAWIAHFSMMMTLRLETRRAARSTLLSDVFDRLEVDATLLARAAAARRERIRLDSNGT